MNRKPRILLIPNVAWWVIGQMGREIIARFGEKYDFYFVPEGLFERRPELLDTFLANVDAVHCLNESSIELFRHRNQTTLPPIATWIHHVTEWSPQHQLAVEKSQALTVCTPGWKQFLSSRVLAPTPITVVPHGVDSAFFRQREVASGKFGIPPDRFVVGFIGSRGSDLDQGRKGTDVLLNVIRAAAAQLPNLHVVLGGPGWEAELAGLRSLGISVSSTGYVHHSDLPSLYSALNLYLLTSRIEGGPCTVFEAMACGTPVVATRVGAVPELIVDGVNGYSAEVDDVESLTKAVITLGESPEMAHEMGRQSRLRVTKLPWSSVLSPLEAVYDDLVQQRTTTVASGPRWMDKPDEVLRTSAAADALSNVINRFRKHQIGPWEGVQLLSEMLERRSAVDVVKGLAMWRGVTYRSTSRSSPSDS